MAIPDTTLLYLADLAQGGIVLINLSGYVPQWKRILDRKCSDDISLSTWCLWLGGSALAQFYAWANYLTHGNNLALIFTDTISILSIMFTIGIVWRYRTPREAADASMVSMATPRVDHILVADSFRSRPTKRIGGQALADVATLHHTHPADKSL